jgi:ABC-type uncharacterized transport system substrate-binding protein
VRRRKIIGMAIGACLIWPHVGTAQKAPIIGFLAPNSAEEAEINLAAFRQAFRDAGFIEGQNLTIEYRWADGNFNRLPALAADLVSRDVDVIIALSTPAARVAKAATPRIPIVFTSGDDPVAAGLVASLARPGGNVTGIGFLLVELHSKRVELISELVPHASSLALLVNPNNQQMERVIRDVQEAAGRKGLRLRVLRAGNDPEIDAAFASLPELRVDALVVGSDPFFTSRRMNIVALATKYSVPTIYTFREFALAGGLMSYAPSLSVIDHQAGTYAARILRGEKPADLAVQQATKFELVINVKTAKALGLTLPQALLARADEVIE